VLRLCIVRLGPERGEDAFQETLLAALRHYDQLRDPAAVQDWLLSIAHRRVVDIARGHARASECSSVAEPSAAAWWSERSGESLWARVARLPPKQCRALALRSVADLPHAEFAAGADGANSAALSVLDRATRYAAGGVAWTRSGTVNRQRRAGPRLGTTHRVRHPS
jgi:DNA-directed RNA polymerase specialized sigma24 family protein